jgi:hypothetical protein
LRAILLESSSPSEDGIVRISGVHHDAAASIVRAATGRRESFSAREQMREAANGTSELAGAPFGGAKGDERSKR